MRDERDRDKYPNFRNLSDGPVSKVLKFFLLINMDLDANSSNGKQFIIRWRTPKPVNDHLE